MFFVWFYAALPVARKSGQGFNARSFADKPCVAHCHYGMRAVAVGLLLLRHVHWVHWVHWVHQAKWFVIKTCASALIAHRVSARSFADKHCITLNHSRMRAVTADFAVTAACPLGPLGPSGKVVRDQTCASAHSQRSSISEFG